jgi:hypothetical protein
MVLSRLVSLYNYSFILTRNTARLFQRAPFSSSFSGSRLSCHQSTDAGPVFTVHLMKSTRLAANTTVLQLGPDAFQKLLLAEWRQPAVLDAWTRIQPVLDVCSNSMRASASRLVHSSLLSMHTTSACTPHHSGATGDLFMPGMLPNHVYDEQIETNAVKLCAQVFERADAAGAALSAGMRLGSSLGRSNILFTRLCPR